VKPEAGISSSSILIGVRCVIGDRARRRKHITTVLIDCCQQAGGKEECMTFGDVHRTVRQVLRRHLADSGLPGVLSYQECALCWCGADVPHDARVSYLLPQHQAVVLTARFDYELLGSDVLAAYQATTGMAVSRALPGHALPAHETCYFTWCIIIHVTRNRRAGDRHAVW
jgi:hypothetical protein